eukprot:12709-Heterococcus_DN1.PRE.6
MPWDLVLWQELVLRVVARPQLRVSANKHKCRWQLSNDKPTLNTQHYDPLRVMAASCRRHRGLQQLQYPHLIADVRQQQRFKLRQSKCAYTATAQAGAPLKALCCAALTVPATRASCLQLASRFKQHRVKTKQTSLDAMLHQRATSPESLLELLMHSLTQYEVQLSWRDVASECYAN